eukprot:TRINITY_DN91259_c0_g1_i1.p1 TRINITY_DN91259_c0_g1~~TRINITY_DN91259_c0_g1_i1.p1  ORF type:complete len:120 (+),score=9.45 TRINITY_DN91259_c0_g1_i1:559-918(+)
MPSPLCGLLVTAIRWGSSLQPVGCCSPMFITRENHVLANDRPTIKYTNSPSICTVDCSHLLLTTATCGHVCPPIGTTATTHKRLPNSVANHCKHELHQFQWKITHELPRTVNRPNTNAF